MGEFVDQAFFKKILFIYFLGRWERREKEIERNINVWEIHRLVASHMAPTRDLALNPGMHRDLELNWRPFGL